MARIYSIDVVKRYYITTAPLVTAKIYSIDVVKRYPASSRKTPTDKEYIDVSLQVLKWIQLNSPIQNRYENIYTQMSTLPPLFLSTKQPPYWPVQLAK